jgi:succinate-acetate transporter protein
MSASNDAGRSPAILAEPTPLGLLGLAVGCAALSPIAFGHSLSPEAMRTAAIFCLLFGGGCQALAGLMSFANRNLLGGTLLTAFSFAWVVNWWVLSGLAEGRVPDPAVLLAVDIAFLVIFSAMSLAAGYFSKLLFFLLVDVVLIYLFKIVGALAATQVCAIPVAICTVVLGLTALWIAFAILVNPVAGRPLFPFPGPVFTPRQR